MTRSYIFVAQGFRRDNTQLQPWRYLYELAIRFSAVRRVIVLTDADDGEDEEVWAENLKVIHSGLLSVRKQKTLALLINSHDPERVWWSATPRSVAYFPVWQRISCPVTALITCPLYPWKILIRAWLNDVPYGELHALLQQRLVPRWLFAKALSSRKVLRVITQSRANRDLLTAAGVPTDKIEVIPVGIDREDRSDNSLQQIENARALLAFPDTATVFLYLGAIRPIRGIYKLLDAFSLAAQQSRDIYLAVLARGANDNVCAELLDHCSRLGIADRVRVIGGWLSREAVRANIEICDVVTLPFIVVPSDVPIAVLEALARGKPVLASALDGIPELVNGRGIVIDPLDKQALARAILELAGRKERREEIAEASRQFMKNYPDWNRVGDLAMLANR